MTRIWMRVILASLAVILIAGCASIDEQAVDGLEQAEKAFQGDAEDPNEEINSIKLFLPSGYSIEDDSDETNILLNKGKNSFILFINPNESSSSKLYYDLMMANKNVKIIKEATFEKDDRFGFVAILENSEDRYELITSIGGIKLTTITKEKDVANNLEQMMMIVRSIQTK
ncbi:MULTISPECIES: hypothetical protein [unclassified Psychrobacillus]|uniref:hypothetical protein n=1 Tax=unclassified Psychrobacillus TaxID=2636677 RepID=UPI0011A4F880|nr:hypothetical protein [Psychrobacillus sp. AK 1817]QEY22640.1 hypothetical protein D0S48_19420 [Psychrobacillus sp. AK 1817]